MKPLVSGVKPPKMPKRKQDGLMKWLKSLTGLTQEETKPTKKTNRKSTRRNPRVKNKTSAKKSFNKKNIPNKNSKDSKNKPKTSNTTKPKQKINKHPRKNLKTNTKQNEKNKDQKFVAVKKQSPIKEIVKEKKVKKEVPTRAKNDPRQKS